MAGQEGLMGCVGCVGHSYPILLNCHDSSTRRVESNPYNPYNPWKIPKPEKWRLESEIGTRAVQNIQACIPDANCDLLANSTGSGVLSMARPSGRVEKRMIQATRSVMNGMELAKKFNRLPLEVILGKANGDPRFDDFSDQQVEWMIAAAPYVHPRLAAVAYIPPNDGRAEQRRDMLRNLGYHQRQAILDILATAQVQQLEGAAEAAEDSSSEEPKR